LGAGPVKVVIAYFVVMTAFGGWAAISHSKASLIAWLLAVIGFFVLLAAAIIYFDLMEGRLLRRSDEIDQQLPAILENSR
jgi:membrane associated rhomboid family serine protease